MPASFTFNRLIAPLPARADAPIPMRRNGPPARTPSFAEVLRDSAAPPRPSAAEPAPKTGQTPPECHSAAKEPEAPPEYAAEQEPKTSADAAPVQPLPLDLPTPAPIVPLPAAVEGGLPDAPPRPAEMPASSMLPGTVPVASDVFTHPGRLHPAGTALAAPDDGSKQHQGEPDGKSDTPGEQPQQNLAQRPAPAIAPEQPLRLPETPPALPGQDAAPLASTAASAPQGVVSRAPVRVEDVPVAIATLSTQGERRFEIRLDPASLGRIEVTLAVDTEGGIRTHIAVERPETLHLLKNDAPRLEQALTAAGLPADPGSTEFSLRSDGGQRQGQGQDAQAHARSGQRPDQPDAPAAPPSPVYRPLHSAAAALDLML